MPHARICGSLGGVIAQSHPVNLFNNGSADSGLYSAAIEGKIATLRFKIPLMCAIKMP